MATAWKNDDGLVLYFGPRTTENNRGAVENTNTTITTAVVQFDYDDINQGRVSPVDGDGGVFYLSPRAVVVDAKVHVGDAFAGFTGITIGFQQEDGTQLDNDGVLTSKTLATADTVVDGDGALIGTTPSDTVRGYLVITGTGTGTAGTGKLILRYADAPAGAGPNATPNALES